MVAFKAFDPDPEITDPDDPYFGTGTWTYDDGTSTYGQGDAEQARQLWKPPPTVADERTASVSPYGQQNMTPKVPGTDALSANEPQSDVGTSPMIARPPEPGTAAQEGTGSGISIPRESRIAYVHNNPGNLKYVGQEGASQGEPAEDGGHWAAFESPEEGVAALQRQIQLDAGRGKTVREFVTKYAPPGSNDTEQYIRQASEALGADPDAKLSDLPLDKVTAFMAQKESSTSLGGSSLPAQRQMPGGGAGGLPARMAGMAPALAEVRGTPLTPDQVQQRQQGVYDQTMAQVAGVQNAAEERQRGREEAIGIVRANHERFQADQQQQLAAATAARAEAERNVQQAMATQLDPGRIIKNMSTGDVVLGVLALALGGLGQTLQQRGGQRGATNGALNMLEKAINDDIEQQKDDKKSRVAHWTKVFNDQEMGIKAARAEMYSAAGQYAQFQAQQKATNADIQAQMMQDSAALIAKGQAETQGLVDKENERVSVKYAPPDPKADGTDKALESFQKQLAARKAYEDAGATPEQLAAFDKAMGIPAPGGESVRQQKTREDQETVARKELELTEGEGKAEAAWQSVNALGSAVGLKRDPKTGRYSADSVSDMLVAPGLKETIPGMLGKGKPIEAARQVAIDGLARLQTGAAISKEEEERFKLILGDESATLSQIAVNLNALETLIQSRRKQNRVQPTSTPSNWKSK
jgi:hypothetical protein